MYKKSKKTLYHILYWIFVILVLLFAFRSSWENKTLVFFYVGMLLPIIMGTSYFFNYVVVPKYYLTQRYARFAFYTFCMAIVSWYLEVLVLVLGYVTVADLSYTLTYSSQIPRVAIILYLMVFLSSFLLMMNQIVENRQVIQKLIDEKEKMKKAFLEIMSNRKMIKIPYDDIVYIESLSDYIKVITIHDEIVSKEKISRLSDRLPDVFLRIHRSFIINTEKIKERSNDEVLVGNTRLNIGRSYRKEVKELLKNNGMPTKELNKKTA